MFDHFREWIHRVGREDVGGERQRPVEAGLDHSQSEGVIRIGEHLGDFRNGPTEQVPEIRTLVTRVPCIGRSEERRHGISVGTGDDPVQKDVQVLQTWHGLGQLRQQA